MTEGKIAHQELLARVAQQLSKTPSATDHLMLTKWRVLSMCQHLLGCPDRELEEACREALEIFAAGGCGVGCDKAIEAAGVVIRRLEGPTPTVLPSISKEKRVAVSRHLEALTDSGTTTITRALSVLPTVRDRMSTMTRVVAIPGIRHRFELVAAALEDGCRVERERTRAGAAVLYVDDIEDIIPDTLGVIGMLDDDYALRVVLEELDGRHSGSYLHWSEKIASLWDDLPFLQGMNLYRGDSPISVTWLDRVNSYVSYSHVLGSDKAPLVLVEPSIACSPLHAIVSLIGLLVLDAVTSSLSEARSLRIGQAYQFDRHVAVYEGVANDPRIQGRLRFRFRNGYAYGHPTLVRQMIATEDRALSDAGEFTADTPGRDPLRRFFNWDAAIGPALISSQLVLVTSRQRALDLLGGVQSNGVRLLDHGFVRFVAAVPEEVDTRGTLILVVPSLSTARVLLDRGVRVQAILIDGYERLHHGRHELPFVINRQSVSPIIIWVTTGYCPAVPPTWMPPHKRLEVSSDDLAGILELDDADTDLLHSSLWEAATGITVQTRITPTPAAEVAIVDAIDKYVQAVRSSQHLPEYWQYHLLTLARTLRVLVTATPAEWSEIKRFASVWSSSIDEKWSSLRSPVVAMLSSLRDAEKYVLKSVANVSVANVSDAMNSRATALSEFLSEREPTEGQWFFVCDRPEQANAVAGVLRALGLSQVKAVLLRDLAVCSNSIVAGWVSSSFARRLRAHTPRAIIALVDDGDRRRWELAAEAQHRPGGQSLFGAVGGMQVQRNFVKSSSPITFEEPRLGASVDVEWGDDEHVPCVFLSVTGELEAKVLARDSRVVVEEGDVVRERVAAQLRQEDRVILGLGTGRWSPADEFTGAVLDAVRTSHPELVEAAKEWRCALRKLRDAHRLSLEALRARLASVGVERESQTLEGWLEIERASPIAPRGLRAELAALWPLVEQYTEYSLEDVASACVRLRALRTAAGRALLQLWKGRAIDLGVDEAWLDDLVERIRQEVQIYDVESVTLGDVPAAMLGWWIPLALTSGFKSDSSHVSSVFEDEGEDDTGAG